MATQTGALITTGAAATKLVGMREDLGDTVSRMDPGSTPAVSWFSSDEATNSIAHDWLTIDLRAPRRSAERRRQHRRQRRTRSGPTRLTNACEIFYEAYGISGTTMAVDSANALGQLVEQRLLKGLELRRDLEVAVLGPQVKVDHRPARDVRRADLCRLLLRRRRRHRADHRRRHRPWSMASSARRSPPRCSTTSCSRAGRSAHATRSI